MWRLRGDFWKKTAMESRFLLIHPPFLAYTRVARGATESDRNHLSMPYDPKPLDTSAVHLTPEILELTELLARNAHETWARQRLADGWRYGSQRDDMRKEHPGLVPYESLPESEKEYDRQTAMGTLKAIIALGYRIAPQPVPGEK
jgi:hypothetical protein